MTVQCSQPPQAHGQGQMSEAGGGEESRGERTRCWPRRQEAGGSRNPAVRGAGTGLGAGRCSRGGSLPAGSPPALELGPPQGQRGLHAFPRPPILSNSVCAWAGSGSPARLVGPWGPGTLLLVFIRRPGISLYRESGSSAVNPLTDERVS